MSERSIFLAALDIGDPTARRAYLDQSCAGNSELRAAVEALLRSHDEVGEFLQTPAVQPLTDELPTIVLGDSTRVATPKEPSETSDDEAVGQPADQVLEFLSPSHAPHSLGRLGHYEVQEVLGSGAFGTVLKAFDEKLHRLVAIKVLNPDLAVTSPPRKRFLREARSAAAVRHEHIVSIHAVEEDPIPYLVMEYIPGQTLQQRLDEQGPLDIADVLRLGQQIARGLAAAHDQGLIHRDIKPGNILLEAGIEQQAKISDFGLARAADDASLTQSGLIAGTPMFMAPEQARGESLDHRADLFSLGSVLYTMTSGRPPFRAPNTIAVLKRVCDDTPRPIREIIPETPPWLCDIISRLMAKDPKDRFSSAREVADLLGRCLSQWQQHGRVSDLPALAAVSPQRSSARRTRPFLRWASGVLAGAAVALGLIAVLYWSRIGSYLWKDWTAAGTAETSATSTQAIPSAVDSKGRDPIVAGTGRDTRPTPSGQQANPGRGSRIGPQPTPLTDLLESPETVRFAARPNDRVDLVDGQLELNSPGSDNLAQVWLQEHPVRNARMRLVVEAIDHQRQGGLELGWDNVRHWPRRVNFVLHTPDDGNPVATFWRFDEGFQTFDLSLQRRVEIDWMQPLEIVCEIRDGVVTARMGDVEIESPHRLDPTHTVIPFLGGVSARWRVREWELEELGASEPGPPDLAAGPWTPLFNGRDLTGWSADQPFWTVEDSCIVGRADLSAGQVNSFLVHEADHADFELRLEYQLVNGNSGIQFRSNRDLPTSARSEQDKPQWHLDSRRMDGPQVEIARSNIIGQIYWEPIGGFVHVLDETKRAAVNRSLLNRQWNEILVRCEGTQVTIDINGVLTADRIPLTMTDSGLVALQLHSFQSPPTHPVAEVKFRNIRHRTLSSNGAAVPAGPPDLAAGPWTPLFNGRDLTGWKTNPALPGQWDVQDGLLTGHAQSGFLFTERDDLANFHLRVEVKAGAGGDSGIMFRTPFHFRYGPKAWMVQPATGYELELSDQPVPRGSLWQIVPATRPQLLTEAVRITDDDRGEWITLELIADGNRFITRVNGHETVNAADPHSRYDRGHIVLGVLSPETVLQIRKLEVRELPSPLPLSPVATVRQYASEEWIDVIPLIDPSLDKWDITQTGRNEWRIAAGELVSGESDDKPHKLLLPIDADFWPSFECELEFTRRAGEHGFNLNFPTEHGDSPLAIDHPLQPGIFVRYYQDGVVSLSDHRQTELGQRTVLRVEVRRQPDGDRITVWKNGTQAGTWAGDRNQLASINSEGYPHTRRLSLWIHGGGNQIVFHRIRMRTLDGGTASTVRPPEQVGSPPAPAESDTSPSAGE